jgi:MFS family permease
MFRPVQTFLSSVYDITEQGFENFLKKPFFLLGDHGKKVGGMFLGLPKRQAVTIYAGLLWVIPIAIANQFESLYLVRQGLSETELGVYRALLNLITVIGFFIGGYVADFWGRQRAIVLFDSISWGGYSLSMALASNKWWCVSALFFMGVVSASVPAYLGLLSEGITAGKRTTVFSVLQIVNLAPFALFFPLLGGFWVADLGILKANHQMYWLFAGMVAVGVFLRWRLLPPSKVFTKTPASWLHGVREGIWQYRMALGRFFQKPASKELLFSKFIDEWIISAWGTYASLYYVNQLGIRDSNLSVILLGSTYVGMLVLFVFTPNFTQRFIIRVLGADQVLGLVAFSFLLFLGRSGENPLLICLFSAGLASAGNALYNSINVSVWMNLIQEKERAKVVAASYALIRIGLTTMTFGAVLYGKVSPEALLWAMIGMRIIGFILLRRVSYLLSGEKRKPVK